MDNASKALMIAGEILISLLVVGLIASAISSFGGFSSNMNKKMAKNKQQEFNNNFFSFEGRIDISADEIASIANFCKHSNDSYELFLANGAANNEKSPYFVETTVTGKKKDGTEGTYNFNRYSSESAFREKLKEFLENNNTIFFKTIKNNPTVLNNTYIKKAEQSNDNIKKYDYSESRGGYVKQIIFTPTKINGTTPLTIENRSEYIIN